MGNNIAKDLSMMEHSNTEKAKMDLRNCQNFSEISSFQNTFQGNVILPFDGHRYRDARYRAFNFDQRGFPLIIVQPKSAVQVAEALDFHRSCPSTTLMTLAVISGGHSSKSMITGAFVIDLLFMNQVAVHKESMTVTVGGGTYVKEIDRALAPYNLAVPTGTYPVVGIGGLALGGGYGWLTRRYGLTVDYISQVEIVLADGRIVVATDTNEYKDLLWACRGGGGNFGIVTSFLLRCVKLPSKCYGGFVFYLTPTIDSAATMLQRYDQLVQVSYTHAISIESSLS
jgi:FAD/FMN-containing dehydrogenase